MALIARYLVLQELDIKSNSDGSPRIFSVKFTKRNGELVFLPLAISCGTGRNRNMSANRERGFMPVDEHGHQQGHVYPVHIDDIIEFNGKKVKL